MRHVAIALIAFAVAGSAADKQAKNASSPPAVVQQQQQQPSRLPLNVQFDRGTDQSPFVVANKQSAEDKSDAHELTAATDSLAKWTVLLATTSFLATAFAAYSTFLARRAGGDLKKLERAYVFVTVERTGISGAADKAPSLLHIKTHFHNHGKTPALLKSLRHYAVYQEEAPSQLIEQPKSNRDLPQGLVIGRDKDWEYTTHEPLTQEQLNSLTGVVQHIYIVGVLKYEDVMGGTHEVGFCWMSQPQQHNNGIQFTICPSKLNYFS